jgi:hypothetical protein
MIRRLILPLLVLGAIVSSVLAPVASAGSKQIYIENLENAYASFYTEDGCYRISGLVVVGEGTAKVNQGEDRAGTDLFAFIDVYDACAKQWLLMSEAGGEDLNVAITPNLRHASINDTVIARNYLADEDVPIRFALDWQANGRPSHDRDVVEVSYPGPDGTTIYSISKAGFRGLSAVAHGAITIGDHVIPIQTDDAIILGVKANTQNTTE